MKDVGLIIWLTQLGLSVVSPLVGFVWLSIWLHNDCGWGAWVVWVGVAVGAVCAFSGLMDSLKTMDKYVKRKRKEETPPPLSFNDHD